MLVSVVMSVYNSEEHLEKSIKSILNQTFRDFEFIIIDDGSRDNSATIIKQYAAKDPRIVFVENSQNLGLATSLNKGIALAKGKYIARQDADDLSTADRLQIQADYALQHEDIDILASNSFIIDIKDNIVCQNIRFSSIKNYYHCLLNKKSIFPHGSAFLKKSKLLEVGLYDPRFYFSQDGEYWLRLLTHGAKVHIIDKPLYLYRHAPVTTNKKTVKSLYNKVKNMIYVDKQDQEKVNLELEQINNKLLKGEWKKRPFYMADYWKGLANIAYVNNGNRTITYRYIYKALKEENPIGNYPKYLMLSLLYMFPYKLTSSALKLIKA